jgi:hypothetical protein
MPVPVEDEGTVLRTMAEIYPTLGDLRLANPIEAKKFLEHTKKQSPKWPIEGLIEGYLDSIP